MRFVHIAALFLISFQAIAKTGSATLLGEIDLKPMGIKIPARGAVSKESLELLFVSDRYLVVLEQYGYPSRARLMTFEIQDGAVRQKQVRTPNDFVIPIPFMEKQSEKVLERIDPAHFAYWTYRGKADRWICDMELSCSDTHEGPAPMTVPHAADCLPADLLGFIDSDRAVCLSSHGGASLFAVVEDSKGDHLYRIGQRALPWDTRMVSSSEGQRFGLEWQSITALQHLNPLVCIDACLPAGKERFVVFNSADGQKLQTFQWDPRPYNLYVLPAISPSGRQVAFVKTDKLVVYDLGSPH